VLSAVRTAGPVPNSKLLYLDSNQYGNLLEIESKCYKLGIIFLVLCDVNVKQESKLSSATGSYPGLQLVGKQD
jgi:hypothetical protein